MSTIKVNTIETRTGSTLTLGKSGDTVSIASGASTSGMGRTGAVDWQTSSIKTESFTGVNGEGYFIDTTNSGSPFKNYAVTVASGTLYGGGSGNIFKLDGSTQQAITLMQGKTYRFTQSDATNDGHPLIISTSNSGTLSTFKAGIVSSGITYNLDGASNQTNYTNTTTFNAATTRYIEFTPSATGTFYFGCWVHGIGMGGAITSENLTLSLPAGSAGNIISIADYSRNFDSLEFVIKPNGSEKIGGINANLSLKIKGQALTLVYVDSTNGWVNVQNAEDTETGAPPFMLATGGTITTVGDYKIHTFTSPGTFTITNQAATCAANTVDYLVVAGGGGGSGAGAGGGGFRFYANTTNNPQPGSNPAQPLNNYPSGTAVNIAGSTSFPITVGAGGTAGNASACHSHGARGSDSVFSTITSTGGGGGGAGNSAAPQGTYQGPGGSGGGAWNAPASPETNPNPGNPYLGTGNTPPVSPSQGSNGGQSSPQNKNSVGLGGGGGAKAVGSNGTYGPNGGEGNSGAGGAGAGLTGFGAGNGQCSSCIQYFSGGGGGGAQKSPGPSSSTAAGGIGGGGIGKTGPGGNGTAGTTNTGGGGGGGAPNAPSVAGAGGSGIVVIRYKFQ